MWSNKFDRRNITLYPVVVDGPCGSRDVATANESPHTHIYMFMLTWAHIQNIPSLLLPAVVIYTVEICFFLHKLLQCASWSWSHTGVKVLATSALLFFCCFLGFGEVGLRNFLGLVVVVLVQFVSQTTFSHRSSIAVIPNQRCSCLRLLHGRLWRSSTNLKK